MGSFERSPSSTAWPRYDLMLQSQPVVDSKSTHAQAAIYACSGFRHSTKDDCHYNIRFRKHELVVAGETFCGRVECSPDGTRCRFCDDPSNFYSFPRELGAVTIADDQMCVLLPRVRADGSAAQFRVLRPEDGIIARWFAGHAREHLMLLSGAWATKRGGEVVLRYLNSEEELEDDAVVFRAKESAGALSISFRHPLSPFQGFAIAVALVHHARQHAAAAKPPAAVQHPQQLAAQAGRVGSDADIPMLRKKTNPHCLVSFSVSTSASSTVANLGYRTPTGSIGTCSNSYEFLSGASPPLWTGRLTSTPSSSTSSRSVPSRT